MPVDKGLEKISDLFQGRIVKKSPAFQWQELALRIIKELSIPSQKRNSVFKICKENSRSNIEQCLNDTNELCQSGEKWRYFFKIAGKKA